MKLKLKPVLITGSIVLAATIVLAVGLSYIPLNDKKIEESSSNNKIKDKNYDDVPGLPDTTNPNHPSNKIPPVELEDRDKSTDIIAKNDAVRYLALGDSISAGFDADLDKDYPGYFNIDTKSVEGISFPAYLAQFIHNSKQNKLAGFNNYAISNTTLEDWNILLDWKNQKNKIDISKLKDLQSKFGNDLEAYHTKVIAGLSLSNLVTVTLGANDFFELFFKQIKNIAILDLVNQIKTNNLNYGQIASFVTELLKDIFTELDNRINTFSKLLKQNSNTKNINFIGYTLPLAHLFKMIDQMILNSNGAKISISQIVIDLINQQLKTCTNANGINFINPYDASFWNKNLFKLMPNLFEIHPGSIGYKKIAQDVFVKLMLPSRKQSEINKNNINWDANYIKSDFDSYLLQMEYEKPFEVISKLFNNSMDEFTFNKDAIYKKYESIRANKNQNYFNRVLNKKPVYDLIFDNLFNNFLESKFFKLGDKTGELRNFLTKNDNQNINQIKNWFIESEYIPKALLKTQKEYFDKYNNQNSNQTDYKFLFSRLKANFANETSIIKLITSFFNIDFVRNEKDAFKNAVEKFIQNIVKESLNDSTINKISQSIKNTKIEKYISVSDFADLLKILFDSDILKQSIGEFLINIIEESNLYAQAKTYNDLWRIFINNPKTQSSIKKLLKHFAKELGNNARLKTILSSVISKLASEKIAIFKDVDQNDVVQILIKLITGIDKFDNEFNIISKLVNNLVSDLAKTPLDKFNFKNTLNSTINDLKNIFDESKLSSTITKIIKIVNELDIKNYSKIISKLTVNALNYYKNSKNILQTIADKFYTLNNDKIERLISKKDFISVLDKTFETDEFKNILNSLIYFALNLDKSKIAGANDLNDLLKIVVESFIKSKSYSDITPLLNKIITFPEVQKLIKNILKQYAPSIEDTLTPSQISSLVSNIINNENFKFILKNFLINGVLGNNFNLFNFNINQALKDWISDENNNLQLSQKIALFLSEITKDKNFAKILGAYLYKLISSEPLLTKDINKEDLINLLQSLILSYNDFEQILGISQQSIHVLLNDIAKNNLKINSHTLSEKIINILKEKITKENYEQIILRLLKVTANDLDSLNNKNVFKCLLINLFDYSKQNPSLLDKLSNFIYENINGLDKYTNADNLKSLTKKIIGFEETKLIYQNIVSNFISLNTDVVQKSTSLKDILNEIFAQFLTTNNYEKIFELTNKIVDLDETKKIIQNIVSIHSKPFLEYLTADEWIELCKKITQNKDFQFVLKGFFTDVLWKKEITFNDLKNIDVVLKNFFANASKNEQYAKKINSFIIAFSNDNIVKKLLAKLIIHSLKSKPALIKDIDLNQLTDLFIKLITKYEEVNGIFDFSTVYKIIFNQLGLNGKSVDVNSLLKQISEELSQKLNNSNIDEILLKLIKIFNKDNLLTDNKHTLMKFSENVITYLIDNNSFANLVSNAILNNNKIKDKILKSTSKDEFNNLLSKIFRIPEFKQLFVEIINNLINSDSSLLNSNDSFKHIINIKMNEFINGHQYSLVKELFIKIVDIPEFIKLIKNTNFSTIDISESDIQYIFKLMIQNNNFNNLFRGILTKGIFSDSLKIENIFDIDSVIKAWLKNPTDYSTIRQDASNLLNDLIKDNKLIDIITNLVYASTSKHPELFDGINEAEFKQFIKALIQILPDLSSKLELDPLFYDVLIQELASKGLKIQFNEIFNLIFAKIKTNIKKIGLDKWLIDFVRVLDKNNLITDNKTIIKKIIANVIRYESNNSESGKNLANIIFKFTNKIGKYITNEELGSLINSTIKLPEFQTFIDQFIDVLLSFEKADLTNATSFKQLINKAFKKLKNSGSIDNLFVLAKKIINFDEFNKLIKSIFNNISGANFEIFTVDQIRELFDFLTDDMSFKQLVTSFLVDGLFSDDLSLNDFDNIDLILKTWLNKPGIKEQVLGNLKNIINASINNNGIRRSFALLIYKIIEKEPILIENIDKERFVTLVDNVISSYSNLNEIFNFEDWLFDEIIDQLATNGTKFNKAKLADVIKNKLSNKFNKDNYEQNLAKLIKTFATTNNVVGNEEMIAQFVSNLVAFATQEKSIGQSLYNALPNNFVNKIKKYLSVDEFNEMIKNAFENRKPIKNLVLNILSSLASDIGKYNKVSNLIDLLKIYVNPKTKITKLSGDILLIFKSIAQQPQFQKLIIGLLKENLAPYGVDVESAANVAFYKDLLANLPKIIENLEIVPNLLNGFADNIHKYNSFADMQKDILKLLIDALKPQNYKFIKVILNTEVIQKHYAVLNDNIKKIANGITSNDKLVNKFITDFDLTNMLVKQGLSQEDAKIFWVSMFKSKNVKDMLHKFLDELFGHISEYAKCNSWVELLEKFFNSSNASQIKELLKKWYVELVSNQPAIFKPLGKLIGNSLRSKGFNIPDSDDTKIEKFILSLAKAIPKTNILNNIIDNVLAQLQKISKIPTKNLSNALLTAIKNGCLSFISNPSNGKIVLSKIFNNINEFNKIFSNIDVKAYSDFINLMFQYAPKDDKKGIFNVMFHSHEANNVSVEIGASGIWNIIQGKLESLISTFITPLMKNYVDELVSNPNTFRNTIDIKKNIKGYQSVWRAYTFFLSILYSNTPGIFFWTGASLSSEGMLRKGFRISFEKAVAGRSDLLAKYGHNLKIIGLNSQTSAIDSYWSGVQNIGTSSVSIWLNAKKYGRDFGLVYVRYQNTFDTKYNPGKLKRDILIEDMKKGYMPESNH
ncbi:SGNH/GDSL hydrolase family protein [Mycoplasmopsis primatum]|uniref:SGNH/GDSL hydrolase family protein n=1 Tax=Mycoplasmopsis primatum TaxID=55604 RepID=UPI000497A2EC|nr:SGNH/GDSL hydrolase family protein [Mycoplasmopsis primatum]